jgi:hypothetical protein
MLQFEPEAWIIAINGFVKTKCKSTHCSQQEEGEANLKETLGSEHCFILVGAGMTA